MVDYPVKDSGEKLTHEEKSFYRSSKRYLQKEKMSSFESFCKFICSKFKKISYEFAIFTYKHFFKKLGENEPDLIETCNQKIQDCEVVFFKKKKLINHGYYFIYSLFVTMNI